MPGVRARLAIAWHGMAWEFSGGLFLALGLATCPARLVLIITMRVASLLGHRGAGDPIENHPPGAEYAINPTVLCLMFLMIGPGASMRNAPAHRSGAYGRAFSESTIRSRGVSRRAR